MSFHQIYELRGIIQLTGGSRFTLTAKHTTEIFLLSVICKVAASGFVMKSLVNLSEKHFYHFCFRVVFTDQDHAQEPGPHLTGPASEDSVLLLQETQPQPRLGLTHTNTDPTHTHVYSTYMHTRLLLYEQLLQRAAAGRQFES